MKSKTLNGFINRRGSRTYHVRQVNSLSLIKVPLFILLLAIFTAFHSVNAQTLKQISGTVIDSKGESIPGVTVFVKGTSKGTITNMNGIYSVQVPENTTTLVFSFIGMKTTEENILNRVVIDVVMENEDTSLEEVVVVGYGTQKKETVTGAISTVNTVDILRTPVSNVGNALVGLVPGISSVQFSGEPGNNGATIRIKGVSTLNEDGQDVLVVIDGLQQDNQVLNALNPTAIQSVSVLKDASATANSNQTSFSAPISVRWMAQ